MKGEKPRDRVPASDKFCRDAQKYELCIKEHFNWRSEKASRCLEIGNLLNTEREAVSSMATGTQIGEEGDLRSQRAGV